MASNPLLNKVLAIFTIVLVGIGVYFIATTDFQSEETDNTNTDAYNTQDPYSWENDPRRVDMLESVNNLTMSINFDNGTVLNWSNLSLTNRYTTVFDLTASKVQIGYKTFRFGNSAYFYITSINDLAEDLQAADYWQVWVNGEYISIGANGYQLHDNDIVEWRYGFNSLQS